VSQGGIDGDPDQPGVEAGFEIEFIEAAISLKKRFLRQVRDARFLSGYPVNDLEDAFLIA
jgi:hypothetical protein